MNPSESGDRVPPATTETSESLGEFQELVRYTAAGYAGGLALGFTLDGLGFGRSAIGQWLVRTLAGEGESILEGIYALRRRMAKRANTMAEAYGWGKIGGMAVPWVIDWGSRLAGVDVNGIPGFYIPFFYAMSDQLGANVSGMVFLRRRSRSWSEATRRYLRHPVMLTGLLLLLVVPLGLATVRVLGFVPSTQTKTALETIVANLCWAPPLMGWLMSRRGGG